MSMRPVSAHHPVVRRLVLAAFLTLISSSARADVSLLVTNSGSGGILRYDATTGAYQGVFAQDNGSVSGLAYGPDGNLYVSNLTFQTVEEFNGTNGSFIKTVIGRSGGLIYPHDLKFGPDGNLYVASGETDSIRQYSSSSGAFLSTFASGDGLSRPTGLAFYGGNLFVSSSANGQILEYNGTTGAFITTFASGNGLSGPAGLTFDASGNLYVANFLANDVLKFTSTGQFAGIFASGNGLAGPGDVAFGPDGNLYVTSLSSNSILEFNGTTGAFIKAFATGGALDAPVHLIFTTSAVPEPSGIVLLGIGTIGLVALLAGRRPRVPI